MVRRRLDSGELINLREMGQLHLWINRRGERYASQGIPVSKKVMAGKPRFTDSDRGAWLEAGLPALYGPQANRPWTQVLRAIAHQTGGIS